MLVCCRLLCLEHGFVQLRCCLRLSVVLDQMINVLHECVWILKHTLRSFLVLSNLQIYARCTLSAVLLLEFSGVVRVNRLESVFFLLCKLIE